MPRTIVIAGGGRNVGKTVLAEKIGSILPDCAVVKVGVHHPQPDKNQLFFDRGASYSSILERTADRQFLVIESGAILDDPDLHPDLVVFLPAPGEDKAGSERRRELADLIRGEPIDERKIEDLARRLAIDHATMEALAAAIRDFRPDRP